MKVTTHLVAAVLCLCTGSTAAQSPKPAAKKSTAGKVTARKFAVTGQVFVVTKGRSNIKLALVPVGAMAEKPFLEYLKARRESGREQRKNLLPDLEKATNEAGIARVEAEQAKLEAEAAGRRVNDAIRAQRISAADFRAAVDQQSAANDKMLAADRNAREKNEDVRRTQQRVAYFDSAAYYFDGLPPPVAVSKTDADGRFALTLPAGRYVLSATTSRSVIGDTELYYWLVVVDGSSGNQSLLLSNDNEFDTKCRECVVPDRVP